MKEEDEDKTSFITPLGVYCYTTMPFGLKNAGATYQRMMQNCLQEQIGRNVQVYVDDIVIKTEKEDTLISEHKDKPNPTRRARGLSQTGNTNPLEKLGTWYKSKTQMCYLRTILITP